MTFDEAIEKIESITDELNIRQEVINDVVSVVEGLRKEYAPTIEMTSEEKATVLDKEEGNRLSWVLTNTGHFDYAYWSKLTERQVSQAWLHPETIKVVDE